jgi:hypothetical protein
MRNRAHLSKVWEEVPTGILPACPKNRGCTKKGQPNVGQQKEQLKNDVYRFFGRRRGGWQIGTVEKNVLRLHHTSKSRLGDWACLGAFYLP